MGTITVEHVEATENVVRGEIACSPELRRFFSGEEFFVEYNANVDDVPESVLVAPILAHVCPVAWTRNADVSVPVLDARFAESLRRVRDTLMQMYPRFVRGGTVRCDDLVETQPGSHSDDSAGSRSGDSGLLFSGGVDSTFSYLRRRDEAPALVSVQGWTLSDHEVGKWRRMKAHFEEFGADNGVDNYFVRSNMLSFLNFGMLQAHCEPHVDGAWYSSVGSGLGLLGLCAPLAHARGLDDIYIAATHWDGISLPWGSHPDIDGNVAWADTTCHHTGYELTRHERLQAIADYVREEGLDLELRTCNEKITENCNDCEKCYRTAVGLLLVGLDPNDHGYSLDAESFERVRRGLENEWALGQDERLMWEDIQSHVPGEADFACEGAEQFFDWLSRVDVSTFVRRSNPSPAMRLVRTAYRYAPYWTYNAMYPVYQFVKKQRRRQRGVGGGLTGWRAEQVTVGDE